MRSQGQRRGGAASSAAPSLQVIAALPAAAAALVETVAELAAVRSMNEIQRLVCETAREVVDADGATFVLRDGDGCVYVEEDAVSPLWKGLRFPLDSCVSGWVILNGVPALIDDMRRDERVPRGLYEPTFVKSLTVIPIGRPEPLGAIGVYWRHRHRTTAKELALLLALSDTAAVAVENVRAYDELETARRETLHRLALAAEFRDDSTHRHTLRVARMSQMVAAELGMPAPGVADIVQAAPLHDIGKLAISDAILLKPGRLTPPEFELVKQHARAGARILAGSASRVLQLAEEIALNHHEWWNGGGYPSGLAGDAIPLSGRIVAVADVFDALVHERTYKPAWTLPAAVAELRRLRGRQFDPDVVDAFLALDAGKVVVEEEEDA